MKYNRIVYGGSSRGRAFSILELLASVAILTLLGILITQVSGAIQVTTTASNRMVDAASQARLAFDRMGLDFDGLLRRWDADFIARNSPDASTASGSDFLQMISSVRSQDRAGHNNRDLSVVGFRVAPHIANGGRPCLLRGTKSIGWDEIAMGLNGDGYPPKLIPSGNLPTIPSPLQLIYNAGSASDYDVLAPGVIRVVVGFQLYPHDEAAVLQDGTRVAKTRGQIFYQPPVWGSGAPDDKYVDLTGISAIVVGLVVADLNSLKLINAAQVELLANQFAVPAMDELPVSKWMRDTNKLGDLPQSIPLPVRQGVRVYQRAFPIAPYGTEML